MLPSLLFISLLISTAAASAAYSAASPSNSTSISDLLPKFALPPGLFPDAVASFSLSENGRFQVHLDSPCYVDFEYLTYYDTNISGVIKYGGIDDLKGVQVRKFLIWFDVDRIRVDLPPSEFIYFDVGWITKKLSLDQFETVHSCKDEKKLSARIFGQVWDFFSYFS